MQCLKRTIDIALAVSVVLLAARVTLAIIDAIDAIKREDQEW
jgi:hypothetical protein